MKVSLENNLLKQARAYSDNTNSMTNNIVLVMQYDYYMIPANQNKQLFSAPNVYNSSTSIIYVLAEHVITMIEYILSLGNNIDQENISYMTPQDQWQVATAGLDESTIKAITVCRFKKGEGLVEDTECAVCLSEFQEDKNLRLLPKCSHAFHLPCINTWLKSHPNCPLCRANVVSLPPPLTSSAVPPHSPTNLDINALQFRRQNDLILVVDDHDQVHREEVVVSLVCENSEFSRANEFRRSISLGAFSRQQLLVADIQSVSMNRYVSTGRFMFSGQNKGKDSVVLS
ncbi:hypothetical protein RND71_007677 [Anisodus tanguticus]|uniref:RING-type E3 ubiquitin transferase n=1 Tax=Anisodus tanguticus TaxID=243964 RepID=A0AAE1VJB6_9SOLA|nr:hypothetical protein RND71_007677 [Anisodus tanguticus]